MYVVKPRYSSLREYFVQFKEEDFEHGDRQKTFTFIITFK